jgi:endo-1,4-beta-xylanase
VSLDSITGVRILRVKYRLVNPHLEAAILCLLLAPIACAQSLREMAEKAGILLGTAVRAPQLSEPVYAATLARKYNMVQPEDAMKWWVLHPDAGIFDFRQGDEIVVFALAHNMKVRGHCLLWGRANPAWLSQGTYTPGQLLQLLREHIEKVMTHYAGQVFAWDVVNEAFDENGNLRDSLWYNQPGIGLAAQGTAYIEQAFRWAHEADPHALLFYNDAEGEELNRKSDAIYAMIKDFKRRGVPIDGVGLQLHVPNLAVDFASLSANIARLTALGLHVQITELDVALPLDAQGNLAHPEDLDRQAEVYRGIARACLQNPGCTAIQTWGFTDKYSWIGSHTGHTRGEGLPFDKSYQPKPAYQALRAELAAGRSKSH